MPRKNVTDTYKIMETEKIYKMYNIHNMMDYTGSTLKCECTINGERGIFKERRSTQSKDHVMEQFAYEIAKVLSIDCCMARCRKTNHVYGAFSRFETDNINNLVPFSNIINMTDGFADDILNATIELTRNSRGTFTKQLYQYIIFDFIMGQLDRHLENLSVEITNNRKIKWYPLYDNGLCLSACSSHDTALIELKNGFYSSRMGDSEYIERTILKFRPIIFPDDIRKLIPYTRINKNTLTDLLDISDKYNQVPKIRREAIIDFMLKQVEMLDSINRFNRLIEV